MTDSVSNINAVEPTTMAEVPHTTLVDEWRICNFCGATQNASCADPMPHFEGCCVPQGQAAIDKEQGIIDELAAAMADD